MPRVRFAVNSLLRHRPARSPSQGAFEYLVQWDGIDPRTGRAWEPTWEPTVHILPLALEEYFMNRLESQASRSDGSNTPDSPPTEPPKLEDASASPPLTPSAAPARPSHLPEVLNARSAPNTRDTSERNEPLRDAGWKPGLSKLPPFSLTLANPSAHPRLPPPPPLSSQTRPKHPANQHVPGLSRTQAGLMKRQMQHPPEGPGSTASTPAKKRRLDIPFLRPPPPPPRGVSTFDPLSYLPSAYEKLAAPGMHNAI